MISDNNDVNEQVTVVRATPTMVVVASPMAVTLGTSTVTLTDSATLSGGYYETGSITFTLLAPNGATVDTEVVPVNGNHAYTTPTGYTLPTIGSVIGVYQWNVGYTGDGNNYGASVAGATNEQVPVSPAHPTLLGTPAPAAVTLGTTAPTLTDSAILAGGYFETGTITFTLLAPNGATVDTEVVNVVGNNTYSTPHGYALPTAGTVTGTYQWNVSYTGDGNNLAASQNNAVSQHVPISKASPSLMPTVSTTNVTFGSTAVVIGSGNAFTASAVLAGGYYETGALTFTLANPSGVVVYTDMVMTAGNGTYNNTSGTSTGSAIPTTAGTYQWAISYAGDGNNNGINTAVGSLPETAVGTGATLVGNALYLVGANTNDQVNIQHLGTSHTGSTGIVVQGQLNGVNLNSPPPPPTPPGPPPAPGLIYSPAPTTIYIVLFNGNDNINMEPTLAIPAAVTDGNGNDNIQLGQGNNVVVVGSGNDNIQLGEGNNIVIGGGGNDNVQLGMAAPPPPPPGPPSWPSSTNVVSLGNGNDNVTDGSNNNDTVTLGYGNDHVQLGVPDIGDDDGDADDLITPGNDIVTLGNGNDNVQLANGNNTITVGSGNDNIQAGDGNNTVTANTSAGHVNINFGDGNNVIAVADASNGQANVQSGDGNNTVTVGNGPDQIHLGSGNNVVVGGNGNDNIQADDGNNNVTLGNGNNNVHGDDGNNTVTLGNGNNNVNLGDGNNSVTAGSGANNIQAGDGNNIVAVADTGTGQAHVHLGDGNNAVAVSNGNNDTVQLGNGNNSVTVGNGNNDQVQANNGNNIVAVGNGNNDQINLGNGNNVALEGSGNLDQHPHRQRRQPPSSAACSGLHTLQVGNGNNILTVNGSIQGLDSRPSTASPTSSPAGCNMASPRPTSPISARASWRPSQATPAPSKQATASTGSGNASINTSTSPRPRR